MKLIDQPVSQVYLYGTCIVDVGFAEAGVDAAQLLELMGVEVHFPQEQSCCGQPAFTSGHWDRAREVARSQLKLFPEDYPIVVLSGSCTGMFRHHLQQLFAENDPDYDLAMSVAGRVVELTEFLVSLNWPDLENVKEKIVIHTSCSARNETNTLKSTGEVLQHWPGTEVAQADHGEECCGFGGTFSVRFPAISAAMADDKCQALEDTGADRLISADCACLLNINGRLAKRGSALRGEHIASFLWRRLQNGMTGAS